MGIRGSHHAFLMRTCSRQVHLCRDRKVRSGIATGSSESIHNEHVSQPVYYHVAMLAIAGNNTRGVVKREGRLTRQRAILGDRLETLSRRDSPK